MPYKSDAQRRFFHAAEARGDISHKTVKEFDAASKGKSLPERVTHKAHGGSVCMYCGGEVDEHGYAAGGEVEMPKPEHKPMDDKKHAAMFVMALRGRK